MQIKKIEDYPVGQVSEAAIIDRDPFASIEHLQAIETWSRIDVESLSHLEPHLDVIEFWLFHCVEMRYLGIHPREIVFHRILRRPANVLRSISGRSQVKYILLLRLEMRF